MSFDEYLYPCNQHLNQNIIEFSPTPQFKSINSSVLSFLYSPTHVHPCLLEKQIALTRWTFASKVMSLLFNILSRLVIALLPRNKHLLIFMAAFTACSDFGAQENKVFHCFHCVPIYLP